MKEAKWVWGKENKFSFEHSELNSRNPERDAGNVLNI